MFHVRLFPFKPLTLLQSIKAYFSISFLTWSIFYGNKAKKDNLKFLRQFSISCCNSCLKKWPWEQAHWGTWCQIPGWYNRDALSAHSCWHRWNHRGIHGAVIFSHQFGFLPPWTTLDLLSSESHVKSNFETEISICKPNIPLSFPPVNL